MSQETPISADDPRQRAVSGKWVLLGMAAMSVVFVGGLYFAVGRVPPYDPQPGTILRRIVEAQLRYRDQDPDEDGADYATLAELAQWRLVDPAVARGTRAGYLYLVRPLGDGWIAVANPVKPGESGDRYYAVDQRGRVVWSAEGAFPLDAPLPADAQQLADDASE